MFVCTAREIDVEGKCSVRVSCCVVELVVAMECGERVAREYRGTNEDVEAIEQGV